MEEILTLKMKKKLLFILRILYKKVLFQQKILIENAVVVLISANKAIYGR